MKKFIFVCIMAIAACSPRENTEKQPAENNAAIPQTSTSTLAAPANYVRNTVNAVGQAKEAAALMEKAQQDRLKAASGE